MARGNLSILNDEDLLDLTQGIDQTLKKTQKVSKGIPKLRIDTGAAFDLGGDAYQQMLIKPRPELIKSSKLKQLQRQKLIKQQNLTSQMAQRQGLLEPTTGNFYRQLSGDRVQKVRGPMAELGPNYDAEYLQQEADSIAARKKITEADALQKNLSIVKNNNTVSQIKPDDLQPGKTFGGGLIASGNPAEMAQYAKNLAWQDSKSKAAWLEKTKGSPAQKHFRKMGGGELRPGDADFLWNRQKSFQQAGGYNPQPWDKWFKSELNSKRNLAEQAKTKRKFGLNTNKPTNPVPKPTPKTPPAATKTTAAAPKGSNALGIASMIAAAVGGLMAAKQTVPGKAAENRSLGWIDPTLGSGISGNYG